MEAEEPLEDLLVIHPHTLQKFMRQGKEFANLLALYTFYSYQAKLQKTNQPLSTDEFTRKGMNWAIDRVKKTKKLLKKMGLVAVVQKGYYSYIQLPFIYTKKKVGELLGKMVTNLTTPKTFKKENLKAKKEKTPTPNNEPTLLKNWLEYCDKNSIRYSKNNVSSWHEKLKNRSTLEQKEALYVAMGKKWKNFYITPVKSSKYHPLLGKSLMLEKDCDTLIDIDFKAERFYYKFKNRNISSMVEPQKLFGKHGYEKTSKKAPMVEEIKDRIVGLFEKF
ncbi:MAG: Unknown protein [uncultured Sulfurovum sp.]|uniref:Uncharacterized protein n=1 Tax=uncultured Sulfurovum sp. TaxID=269237 RepID=A0A6S6SD31_9BACT|nr:MAG: Unknown protein [uncultured Sulfurovum sp.]